MSFDRRPPIHERRDHDEFAARLCSILDSFIRVAQPIRRAKYGEAAAATFPMGHTPPELREEYEERVERLQEQWDRSSRSAYSDEGCDDEEVTRLEAYLRKKEAQYAAKAAADRQNQVQHTMAPVRPESKARSNAPHDRKRRRGSDPVEEEATEGKRPTKMRAAVMAGTRASRRLRRLHLRQSARLASRHSAGGTVALSERVVDNMSGEPFSRKRRSGIQDKAIDHYSGNMVTLT